MFGDHDSILRVCRFLFHDADFDAAVCVRPQDEQPGPLGRKRSAPPDDRKDTGRSPVRESQRIGQPVYRGRSEIIHIGRGQQSADSAGMLRHGEYLRPREDAAELFAQIRESAKDDGLYLIF